MRNLIEKDDPILGLLLKLITAQPFKGPTRVLCNPNENVRGTGLHKHRCEGCGTAWKHGDDLLFATEDQFHEGHTCPKCGKTEQREKYGAH